MYILITGATGFLGTKLIKKLLDKNYKIIAVVRKKKSIPKKILKNPNITWLKCNLEKETIKFSKNINIKAAFHLAGATSGKKLSKKEFLKKNEITTINFLKSIQLKTNRIIYTSSQVVYGNPGSLNISERFPLTKFPTPYSLSKINGEIQIKKSQEKFNNMSIILRLSGFIEGGGNIDYIIDCALKNKEILLYSKGSVRRDYMPVNNAIEVFVKCIDLKYNPQNLILNLGSGKALSSFKIASIVCRALNSKSTIRLSTEKVQINDFLLDIDKSNKFFNLRPVKIIDEIKRYSIYKKTYEKN